jgi:hypothetical protein
MSPLIIKKTPNISTNLGFYIVSGFGEIDLTQFCYLDVMTSMYLN